MSLYSFNQNDPNKCQHQLTFTLRGNRHLINYICRPADLSHHLFQGTCDLISPHSKKLAGCRELEHPLHRAEAQELDATGAV